MGTTKSAHIQIIPVCGNGFTVTFTHTMLAIKIHDRKIKMQKILFLGECGITELPECFLFTLYGQVHIIQKCSVPVPENGQVVSSFLTKKKKESTADAILSRKRSAQLFQTEMNPAQGFGLA